MHNNKLVGKGGKHPLTVWAREKKLRMTPKDLSTATVYCPFSLHARVDADVSGTSPSEAHARGCGLVGLAGYKRGPI